MILLIFIPKDAWFSRFHSWSFALCKEHSKEERENEREYHLDAVIDYANLQDPWI